MATRLVRLISDVALQVGAMIDAEIREALGPNATFEQLQDAAAGLANDALWSRADTQLREAITGPCSSFSRYSCVFRFRCLPVNRSRAQSVIIADLRAGA